jgi:serine/threonine-protein kinase HipA
MIYRLKVWEKSSAEHQPVGELLFEIEENGRVKCAFRYDREYLGREGAYALDPVSLPLTTDHLSSDYPGTFGVFEDSLPDDWGRKHRITFRQTTIRLDG